MLDLGLRMRPGDDLEPGIGAGACSTIWPASNALGIATTRARAPADWNRLASAPMPRCRRSSRCPACSRLELVAILDHRRNGRPSANPADQAADPAIADQHDMVGQLRRRLLRVARCARRRTGRRGAPAR